MKQKIVQNIREKGFVTQREAEHMFELVRTAVLDVLVKDGTVRLQDIGTLTVKERMFNVNKIGEPVKRGKRTVVRFKVSKSLKDGLNS